MKHLEQTLAELQKTIVEMRIQGRLTEALRLAKQGLLVAHELESHTDVLDLYHHNILIHYALGDIADVMGIIHEYGEYCRTYGIAKDFMHYYLIMALIYDLVGIKEKTIEMTAQSIKYAYELNDVMMLVRCYNNLCYLEVENGSLEEARKAGLLAREYNKELYKQSPQIAKLHHIQINNNLADVYILEEDYASGQALLEDTLQSDIIQHHQREAGIALFGYGLLYEKQQKLEAAVSYYKKAIQVAQTYGDDTTQKKVMRMLLNVLYQLNWRDEIFDVQRAYIELTDQMDANSLLQQVMNLEFNLQKVNLEKKALYDPLTGVLNRYFIQQEMDAWLKTVQDSKQYVAVAVLDLDKFKNFNDQYGHLLGDQVLQIFAKGLQDFLQEEDVHIIRYGGDEFIVCLCHQDKHYIKSLADQLHAYLLTLAFTQEGTHYMLKVSMGICINDQRNYEYRALFEQADGCLYQAKNNGRGRYVILEL
ncbi:tetratricopeptide repeat-containing diguanylate cyclase [Lysinibacillus piscis]|uniref:tetratricopeptide repeat-containing diguanylate cyclase n=1 Tax=Lysinibacillus piscis TaxID=2518931 RepID=UPI002232C1E9|nr:tetratricopeptide repeat-containing diguanylate cyclase [Lysinibacillus sp. KH24]